jgi:N,N'-diacetyllegionaminate synthase
VKNGLRQIGSAHPPYIIAEIGVNHDGSVERAIELVEAAKLAGADAIKLQLFETDRLLSRAAKLAAYQTQSGADDPFAMLRALELTIDQMSPVVAKTHELELHAIVTVFSVELVTEAQRLAWDAYKTASPDIINQPLIESLMSTGQPLLLSTGAATLEEIAQATAWLGNHPHLLMHCVSAYPTPDDFASLAARPSICEINPNALGYSDHTTCVDTGGLAVASGVRVLEKHLTHDRKARGPDHAASLDTLGFAEYVRLAHRAFRMLGEPRKRVLAIEEDVRQVSRQSITSTRSLDVGAVLQPGDLTIKRPGTGLPPHRFASILGRRLGRAVAADMPIVEDDLE